MVTIEFGVERNESELLGIRIALEQPLVVSDLVAMTVHAYIHPGLFINSLLFINHAQDTIKPQTLLLCNDECVIM